MLFNFLYFELSFDICILKFVFRAVDSCRVLPPAGCLMRLCLPLFAVGCLGFAFVASADDFKSGLEVGKPAPSFEMKVVTGDEAGKEIDYLARWEKKPVLVIFIGEMTRPGFGLLKMLDKYGRLRQPEGLEVLIVRASEESEMVVRQTKAFYDNYDIKSPAGFAEEGAKGPPEYGLHEEAQMTVLLLDQEHKVRFNAARRAPDRSDFDKIRKEIDRLLGPSPVPFPEQ